MPDRELSQYDYLKLKEWLDINASLVNRSMTNRIESWKVGETKEPLIIRPQGFPSTDMEVTYPTGSKEKLSESGVIFEAKSEALPPMGAD